jgi:hypothetical protein
VRQIAKWAAAHPGAPVRRVTHLERDTPKEYVMASDSQRDVRELEGIRERLRVGLL